MGSLAFLVGAIVGGGVVCVIAVIFVVVWLLGFAKSIRW